MQVIPKSILISSMNPPWRSILFSVSLPKLVVEANRFHLYPVGVTVFNNSHTNLILLLLLFSFNPTPLFFHFHFKMLKQ